MMIEQATVIAYHNGMAKVQCMAKSGCGSCSAREGCGTASLSALSGEKFAPQFELAVPQPLNLGDVVEIGISENSLLQSVFWLYGVPLLTLLLSAVLFSYWFENELIAAFAVFCCTFATFWRVKKYLNSKQHSDFTPIFLRRV